MKRTDILELNMKRPVPLHNGGTFSWLPKGRIGFSVKQAKIPALPAGGGSEVHGQRRTGNRLSPIGCRKKDKIGHFICILKAHYCQKAQ